MSEEREATNSPPSNGAAGNRTRIDSSAQRGGAAKSQDEQVVKIIDLKPDMLSLCVDFICLEKSELTKMTQPQVCHFRGILTSSIDYILCVYRTRNLKNQRWSDTAHILSGG